MTLKYGINRRNQRYFLYIFSYWKLFFLCSPAARAIWNIRITKISTSKQFKRWILKIIIIVVHPDFVLSSTNPSYVFYNFYSSTLWRIVYIMCTAKLHSMHLNAYNILYNLRYYFRTLWYYYYYIIRYRFGYSGDYSPTSIVVGMWRQYDVCMFISKFAFYVISI